MTRASIALSMTRLMTNAHDMIGCDVMGWDGMGWDGMICDMML